MEFVGGQAVIEGVLIKGPKGIATAIREQNGDIHVKEEDYDSILNHYPLLKLPLLRGPVSLIETMVLGTKALNYSAEKTFPEEEKKSSLPLFITITLSFLAAILLFKLLPLGITELALRQNLIPQNQSLFALIEGIIKLSLLIGYILIIGQFSDIKRVFQYHGAEHKLVNAYEQNDLEHPEKYSRIHVRCGTSFILFVLSLSILIYLFVPIELSLWGKILARLALLPLIAGLAYELIRLSPKHEKRAWFKILISPGLFLQRLTTREPDKDQLAVAKAALLAVI